RHYGQLLVPGDLRYVQAVKQGGRESEELVLADLAAGVVEQMEPDTLYLMGSGSTVAACMGELGLENTLLGVDLVENGQLIGQDLSAAEILTRICGRRCRLIITLIGGQGHLFGRGNQQLSPDVIRAVGREHIQVLATKAKLAALEGRPLLVDTDDPALNRSLSGYLRITTGYKDQVIYPVANPE
ncbi:ATP-NAD kinase, partial [Aeromonas caviae]|uniref:ATP-NAD kinase family protein n=2 Tax=Aeromonadaceae TaxID=84642 RepID=UPI000FBDE3FD